MTTPQPELRALFCDALERQIPEERAAYLDAACQGKPGLRERVEALLQAHEQAGGFLKETGRAERASGATIAGAEGPGTRLLDRIKID